MSATAASDSKLRPKRGKASITTLVTMFALAAVVQALAPAPAAAVDDSPAGSCQSLGDMYLNAATGKYVFCDFSAGSGAAAGDLEGVVGGGSRSDICPVLTAEDKREIVGEPICVRQAKQPSWGSPRPRWGDGSNRPDLEQRVGNGSERKGGSRGGRLQKSKGKKPTKPGQKNPNEKNPPDPLKQCLVLQNQQVNALAGLGLNQARVDSILEASRLLDDLMQEREDLGTFSRKFNILSARVDAFMDRHPIFKSGLDLSVDVGELVGSTALFSLFDGTLPAANLASKGALVARVGRMWPLLLAATVWAEYEYYEVDRENTFERARLWEEIKVIEKGLRALDLGAETKAMMDKMDDLARIEREWMQLGCWGIMPPDTGHL